MTEQEAGSFFQDETKLQTNPKVGFCWMRRGKHKPLRTPGTNRKIWISGALNFKTGRLHWVCGERRNDELFIKLLDKLRRTYRCHKELHLATDNDSSHLSKRVKEYVQESAGRIRLHPLPAWSPESNPVEVVWWSLQEAVSRNHGCAGLDDLVEFAAGYLEERSRSGRSSVRSTSVGRGHHLAVGRVFIYLVELSSCRLADREWVALSPQFNCRGDLPYHLGNPDLDALLHEIGVAEMVRPPPALV